MKIVYVHASKYGNGARVADEFRNRMANDGIQVETHHVEEVEPGAIGSADLYVFSSPGRMGRPIRSMRHFLKDVRLPRGTRYALLTTEMAPQPDKKTGHVPTEEEICRFQHVRPIMIEILQETLSECVAVAEVARVRGHEHDGFLGRVVHLCPQARPD